jgi:hypothetical protein
MTDTHLLRHTQRQTVFPQMKFGRLTAIRFAGRDKGGNSLWECECECGRQKTTAACRLSSGKCQSCGCLAAELTRKRSTTHGRSASPEYTNWRQMMQRCYDHNSPNYPYYGQVGIKVCPRWMKFENFFADMGERPSREHTVDRIDTNGDYTPENCRWATQVQQQRNKNSNRILHHNGKSMCIAEWAEETGIHPRSIQARLERGWSDADTLTKPLKNTGANRPSKWTRPEKGKTQDATVQHLMDYLDTRGVEA